MTGCKNTVIPSDVVALGPLAFYGCSGMTQMDMPAGVKKIGERTFAHCSGMESLSLNVETLPAGCFYGCSSLKKVELGNDVRWMNDSVFAGCAYLAYLVLPQGMKSIGKGAFANCGLLRDFICTGTAELGFSNSGASNYKCYYPKDFVSCSNAALPYNGITQTPVFNFTSNLPAGFDIENVELNESRKDVGTYNLTPQITFANKDMTFVAEVPFTYSITPLTLSAKVKDASRLYGDENPRFQSDYSGFVDGEDASIIISHGTYATNATPKSDIGTYAVEQTGATAKNYVFTYEPGVLTVTKAPLVVKPRSAQRTYGEANPQFALQYTGLKNNEAEPVWVNAPVVTTEADQRSKVGDYNIVVANAEAANYETQAENGTLTVVKAPLKVMPQNVTRKYGEANREFSLMYEGLKNDETSPEWVKEPAVTTTATASSPVGSYDITIAGGEAANYELEKHNGTLTVTKAPLTIMIGNHSRAYGDPNPQTYDMSYAGLVNDETSPEWISTPTFKTNATVRSSVGDYAVSGSGGQLKNYSIESITDVKLTILPAQLLLTAKNAMRQYYDDDPAFSFTGTGFKNSDDESYMTMKPTFTTTATRQSSVGSYEIKLSGAECPNYTISYASGTLSVTPRPLNATTGNYERYYNEENPIFEVVYSGFMGNDDATVIVEPAVAYTSATKTSDVGVYTIDVKGGYADNYTFRAI